MSPKYYSNDYLKAYPPNNATIPNITIGNLGSISFKYAFSATYGTRIGPTLAYKT